ncbi:hypothetical protein FGO68_gene1888 [Halteria grandinella]|uniref:RING-type domain-containing protein n=1 Tax=Halteria grandinella TaxID=5974 RepID=A0A8J8NMK0_HALGN|nr:hypothetical protein FGO68_gene1888 [Halteria grandinella]
MGVTIEEASLWAQHKSKIFVALGIILLSKAAQYLFKAMRQGERIARDHDQQNIQIVQDHQIIPIVDERVAEGEADSACYVCMENKRRVAFQCGHLCVCIRCKEVLVRMERGRRRCPVCRVQIEQANNIFY